MRDVGESGRLSVPLSASGHYLLKIPTLKVPLLWILPGVSCPGITGLLPVSVHRCKVIFLSRRVLHIF